MTNPDNIVRVRARNGGRASVYEVNGWAQGFTAGIVDGSGVIQNTVADMNVLVGGSASKPDVVLAENPSGYRIALDLVGQQPIAITAPASSKRITAIVAYTDDLSLSTTEDTVTGSPASCGLIAVNGTAAANPSDPTDAQIRAAITSDGATGSQAAYCVIATILVESGTTAVTNSLITNKVAVLNGAGVVKADNVDFATYKTGVEEIVGTWVDGKPIYRQMFSGTLSVTANNRTTATLISNSNIDNIVACGGSMDYGATGKNFIPFAQDTDYCIVYLTASSNNLTLARWATSNRNNLNYILWVEYTKQD